MPDSSREVPIYSGLLLDIEGTVGPIAFVTDVMFPFVLRELDGWLETASDEVVVDLATQYAYDRGVNSLAEWQLGLDLGYREALRTDTHRLMEGDEKTTGLKRLQGMVWEAGFRSGELRAEVYDDVPPHLEWCRTRNVRVRIYSSGSVAAQKLFFGHSVAGDLLPLVAGHDDTTTGPKKESRSYSAISEKFALPPGEVLFVSDVTAELDAARDAGMQTRLAIRPGNPPQPPAHGHATLTSFDELRPAAQ